MSDHEIIPDWAGEDDANVPPVGLHIVIVRVERATFDESYKGKPFMHLGVKVIEEEFKDMEFPFDVYFSPKAERMARYFLKKFGYPEDLLAARKTPLKSQALVGLQGKVLIRVEEGADGLLRFWPTGYAHWPPKDDAGELEKRLAKMTGKDDADTQDDVPVIQLDEEEVEVIPGAHGSVVPPRSAEPSGDDPNFLAFLDDLPRCEHQLIECENGEKVCPVCDIDLDGPWNEVKG